MANKRFIYDLIAIILLLLLLGFGLGALLTGCKPNVVYIPGDDETSNVVYFVNKGDESPIHGIVLSKAKFYRLCKRAKMKVDETEMIKIVPAEDNDND